MSDQQATAAPAEHDEGLASPEPGAHEHYPDEWQYVKVAIILFAITMLEVAVYYISGLRDALPPILLSMSVVKFALVALYFMHLRFDSKFFRRLFVTGIILALGVYMIALTSLHVFSR
jgi:cytochrome c oxidase subunit IV